ncbi:FadR/GntR family transcriptional regulator [Oscillospiraceae bacterium LTW-04]|nr:GntR family transcriptional regulator [Oscillospiraceae bacterium MB24-C1]
MPIVERVNATMQVVNSIKYKIQSGELKTGDKLPKEADLAKELCVGRSSLREGIKILIAYGVVESRQGEGTFIVDHTAKNFFEFMGFFSNRENMAYFLELRRVIEIGNIIAVYDKIPEDLIFTLEKSVEVLAGSYPVEAYVEADKAFHNLLISYTKNPMIIQINNMIGSLREDLLYKLFCNKEIVDDAYKAHTKILNAIKAHNLNTCISAVRSHIDTTAIHMNAIYDNISVTGKINNPPQE